MLSGRGSELRITRGSAVLSRGGPAQRHGGAVNSI